MPSTALGTVRVVCKMQFLLSRGVYSLIDKGVMHMLFPFELNPNDEEKLLMKGYERL